MHLVNDADPHKQAAQIRANIASSTPKKSGSSMFQAIKNKLNFTKKPIEAYYDRKVKKHNDQVNKDVGMIKDYRAMRDSGSSVTQTPEFRKAADNYAALKNKYSK